MCPAGNSPITSVTPGGQRACAISLQDWAQSLGTSANQGRKWIQRPQNRGTPCGHGRLAVVSWKSVGAFGCRLGWLGVVWGGSASVPPRKKILISFQGGGDTIWNKLVSHCCLPPFPPYASMTDCRHGFSKRTDSEYHQVLFCCTIIAIDVSINHINSQTKANNDADAVALLHALCRGLQGYHDDVHFFA